MSVNTAVSCDHPSIDIFTAECGKCGVVLDGPPPEPCDHPSIDIFTGECGKCHQTLPSAEEID